MHADAFYQTQSEGAVPLVLINSPQWHDGKIELSEGERCQLQSQGFKAKLGQLCLIYAPSGQLTKAFLGQGEAGDAQAMAYAATLLPEGHYETASPLSIFAQVNWALAQYRFDRYKKQDRPPRRLVVRNEAIKTLKTDVEAVFLVRDLINTPSNDLGPAQLAEVAAELARQYQADFCQWVGDELLAANFPAIHVVGRASEFEPRLIQLTWGKAEHPKIALVGKGVCFDSGGLDIKPALNMRLMKKDMGGAANVLGLAQWIMANQLPVRLQVFIPAVENAVGSRAFRPGDVLTMRNGLTVEVDNTDAEGRLILADAMVKACEEEPELLIDFSTLTGAARVAVGTEIAALFTGNDELAMTLSRLGEDIHDPVWRLPLFSGYDNMLDSSVADIVNASPSPYAGAITAALFLKRFIHSPTQWIHFDIMAWNLASKPGKPEGGEAMGMRTIARYLKEKYG
ncbi:leucyl aminopeptidase family protein [Legionella taurinensis]|uniref:Leucyl aminopeptidase family protein n=1 Tax=Legionella taurinensis TaxID=70611 RepID=A0A3A5LJ61_9GAMM|nr:leucyl aminopeptidase family protein [Legionella taurinensis]RJT48017.1 leucyl aminopeptidase family protein [Legionella taurinensis]RJT68231.1 leucyl aminopeptidase family protein [Legionella taurinensis]STY25585.1 aminopeptidase [Legionella taurinensis]